MSVFTMNLMVSVAAPFRYKAQAVDPEVIGGVGIAGLVVQEAGLQAAAHRDRGGVAAGASCTSTASTSWASTLGAAAAAGVSTSWASAAAGGLDTRGYHLCRGLDARGYHCRPGFHFPDFHFPGVHLFLGRGACRRRRRPTRRVPPAAPPPIGSATRVRHGCSDVCHRARNVSFSVVRADSGGAEQAPSPRRCQREQGITARHVPLLESASRGCPRGGLVQQERQQI